MRAQTSMYSMLSAAEVPLPRSNTWLKLESLHAGSSDNLNLHSKHCVQGHAPCPLHLKFALKGQVDCLLQAVLMLLLPIW